MPSFSDRYSSYSSLFSFSIGLCLTVRSALSVKLCESMCVCVFVFMSVSFFYATLSSFSSQCASSSSVSQAFLIHFCDLQPILSHHPSAFSIPPFTLFILLHTSGNFMLFHLSIVHRLLPYLSILHNTWNHFFFVYNSSPFHTITSCFVHLSLSFSNSPSRPSWQMRH